MNGRQRKQYESNQQGRQDGQKELDEYRSEAPAEDTGHDIFRFVHANFLTLRFISLRGDEAQH